MKTAIESLAKTMVERLTGVPFNNGYRWLYPYIFISFVVMLTAVFALAMPGAYQLRVASAASLASPAVYTVPFSVPEGCP